MKIFINEEAITLEEPISVEQLLQRLDRLQPGTALAINQIVIPRPDWSACRVQDGDDILLFQAIAGG
ncbi:MULTISPECIES: sulfur carrier protein ThiS [Lonsdalea]|uniref:Thiamine biosynthesis protein ThiS n=2 Tax=Lonsdalea TaxID=1082702 RepID=A0ACD1JAI7_9GAMM|nr:MULTISPECIES: sulfur carrier protein ThiS [Lonsdalea]OSM94050.1 thiamine biosynthesis protein ThiS [Lonsdalea populi]OSM95557.1 thiamine biosynthesis protein ThiS [Lonsdalea populi]QPQ24042.1 sulfur carrier protein ThiS [Lonsdalea populi]RAT12138.1 thiamine biosynthesis protein ThiS [Lonsdalea quercina]RAT14137.1 thiamine biosynthesis protein ThiS [Lonsdalea quercina]